MSAKATMIKEAQDKLKELEKGKKYYESQLSNSWMAPAAEPFIKSINAEINDVKKFLAAATSASDLATVVVKETANQVLAVLDGYIKNYGNQKKELVNINSPSLPLASVGIVSATASVGLKIEAKLESKRTGNKVESKASISSTGYLKLGVKVGFSAPIIGNMAITGGVKGNANLVGAATLEIEAVLPDLVAYMNPAAIDFGLSAELFLDLPKVTGVETVLGWIADAISSVSAKGCTLYFKLGSINVLTISTPTYSIKFSMSKGAFHSPKSTGNFSAKLNKKVTDTIDYVIEKIKYYASKLNPVTLAGDAWDAAGDLIDDIF